MNSNKDIRWIQRFQNFDRAFLLLRSALEERGLEQMSELEKEGLIQRFEYSYYSYELAWKTMKDYLEEQGTIINPATPRNVIKEAFSAQIIADGQVWVDMMLPRNLLAHTYDFSKFKEVLDAVVERYLDAQEQLHEWFLTRQMQP